MSQILYVTRYNTDAVDVVASDKYWDGSNWDRSGRNTTLYKTKKGNFFLYHETRFEPMTIEQAQSDPEGVFFQKMEYIEPMTIGQAKRYYERLPEHEMTYEEAFGEEPEEA